MDFFGLNEEDTNEATDQEVENQKELNKELKKTVDLQKGMMEETEAPSHIEKLIDAAEQAYDAGMDVKEIINMIEQHLGLKMGE
jgi:2,4-dienoyl-CoA reductase-like NADH-dependent reductase (Old Yellow Enzyme family)